MRDVPSEATISNSAATVETSMVRITCNVARRRDKIVASVGRMINLPEFADRLEQTIATEVQLAVVAIERPKRTRYIEQVDDDELLESDTQVRALSSIPCEEGEIMDTNGSAHDAIAWHAPETWDDYGIVAVGKGRATPRYTIGLIFNNRRINFMIDTGSPVSFIDAQTAEELVEAGSAQMKDLSASEQSEQFRLQGELR